MPKQMMRALVKKEARPGLWMQDVPVPTYKDDEVRVKITKTSLCGTDLHIYNWDAWSQKTVPVPLVIGHEFCGVVEAVGRDVKGVAVGDRVSGDGHLTCGYCRNCRAGKRHLCRNTKGIGYHSQGCFAEYLTMPAANIFKLPTTVPDTIASIFDPFGNAVHATLQWDLVGEDVLITGAGPIGMIAVAIARHVGARHIVITDVNDYRLDIARSMGATRAINAKTTSLKQVMTELDMKEGFDIGLEMSGNGVALRDMLGAMNHGGKVSLLGIYPDEVSIDWSVVIFRMLTLRGIYGREMFETWYKMTSLLQSGLDIQKAISHLLRPEEFEKAFQLMRDGQSAKVVLDWE